MTDPQPIDWDVELRSVIHSADAGRIGAVVLAAAGSGYVTSLNRSLLLEFSQFGATYLFDQASAADADHADRTVAAWAVTPDRVDPRDVNYQRGFPLADPEGHSPRDRGHLIPHLSGGQFGPNIYPQSRELNRGWSNDGKRYRGIERHAADHPGCFFFGRLVYTDNTDYPTWVEIGAIHDGSLTWARFSNRDVTNRTTDHGPSS